MTWTYFQKTGAIYYGDTFVDRGYSGHGDGKNNPSMQGVKNFGPIPAGVYRIGNLRNSQSVGPDVMDLTPDAANEMFGRDCFRIHGDSIKEPGTASHGCIVLPLITRRKIAASGDRELVVVGDTAK
jgi:hypothetical protein